MSLKDFFFKSGCQKDKEIFFKKFMSLKDFFVHDVTKFFMSCKNTVLHSYGYEHFTT